MFSFWKKKKVPFEIPYPLHFKDGRAALDYASEWMVCDLRANTPLPALVVDRLYPDGKPFPINTAIDGTQHFLVHVAGRNGGFFATTQTVNPGPELSVGDLVAWMPVEHMPQFAAPNATVRMDWIGFVVAKLTPSLTKKGWMFEVVFVPND